MTNSDVTMPEDLEPLRDFARVLFQWAMEHPMPVEGLSVVVEVGPTLRFIPADDGQEISRQVDQLRRTTERIGAFIAETKAMVTA